MRILIAYASKSGTTRAAAELLAGLLTNHDTVLADLAKSTPDPTDFDYAVLATPVRFSRPHRAMRAYLSRYAKALAALPHTLCLCCAFEHQFDFYLTRCYPELLRESAEEAVYCGGDLDPSKQRGWDKIFTRMVRNAIENDEGTDEVLPGFLPEHVRILADRLRQK
jgi:menaquinone-dependent protoporphyrinogen IX oxidase